MRAKTCPECHPEVVMSEERTYTAASVHAFKDKNNAAHVHDPNTLYIRYRCIVCGHQEFVSKPNVCWCGWSSFRPGFDR